MTRNSMALFVVATLSLCTSQCSLLVDTDSLKFPDFCEGVNKHPECDDKNACTSDEWCLVDETETCNHAPVACNDNNPCTTDYCDQAKGCVFVGDITSACNDEDKCTENDVCSNGTCSGKPIDCNDDNECTDDVCDQSGWCLHAGNTNPCDDGYQCNGKEICRDGACSPATAPPCGTVALCVESTGECLSCLDNKDCDDSTDCTVDECKAGKCEYKTKQTNCFLDLNCQEAGDSRVGDACQVCEPEVSQDKWTPLVCNDNDPCTTDSCDQVKGCTYSAIDSPECNPQPPEPDSNPEPAVEQDKPDTTEPEEPDTEETAAPPEEPQTVEDQLDVAEPPSTPDTVEEPPEVEDTGVPDEGDITQPPDEDDTTDTPPNETEDDVATDNGGDNDADYTTEDTEVVQPPICEPADCNDQNPCTDDQCDPVTGCQHTANSAECDDQNPCTEGDKCQDKECKPGVEKKCDDGLSCTVDVCGAKTGQCESIPQDVVCEDGIQCTTNDCIAGFGCVTTSENSQCDDGNGCTTDMCNPDNGCQHVMDASKCNCLQDTDCAKYEDGDLCNGTLVCHNNQCSVSLPTIPDCTDPFNKDPCLRPVCNPETGACDLRPTTDNTFCNDNDECTVGDGCLNGICVGSQDINCNDQNPCTDDQCDPAEGCVHTNNTKPCDDKDACTVGDGCTNGACVAGKPAQCDNGNKCDGIEWCDKATGCKPGTPLVCDDGFACTTDSCDQAKGCMHTANIAVCDDSQACTFDLCNPTDGAADQKGCIHTPLANLECNDGNGCTSNDKCNGNGVCVGVQSNTCTDNNPCTTDTCDATKGCIFTPNVAPCDDGNKCTLNDSCSGGSCQPGTAQLVCDDGNECTDDYCYAAQGCVNVANTVACNDHDVCSYPDWCKNTVCAGLNKKNCNDSNPCTTDTCDPVKNCQHTLIPGCTP